jgi:hypothetical protein
MPSDQKLRDRRSNGRIAVNFPVEMTDISFAYSGTGVDLSPGGVRVRMSKALPPQSTDLDLVLRPPGEALLKLKGRVMHAQVAEVGVAFAVGDLAIFEVALNLYESLVMRDPKLAIRLKQRPTTLDYTQRLYPRSLGNQVLSGPEHWVYGKLAPEGTLIWDLRKNLGADWSLVAFVPFALLERGVAGLQPGQTPIDEDAPAQAVVARPAGPKRTR